VDESSSAETRLAESEESEHRRGALSEAINFLDQRERRIFQARRLADDPTTLDELSVEFSISRERVRQIEVHAFQKVAKAVKGRVAAKQLPQFMPAAANFGATPALRVGSASPRASRVIREPTDKARKPDVRA
jgi:RNA polymerase sigma-32 factor